MTSMSATDVRNKIGMLWELVDHEPVIIESNGKPRYIIAAIDGYAVIPRAEFDRLNAIKAPPTPGFAKHLFDGINIAELLDLDISGEFQDYM